MPIRIQAAALALLLAPVAAPAQALPAVDAGGVATVPIVVAGGVGTARYRIAPTAGVRLFGALEGMAVGTDSIVIPLTFPIAKTQAAGPMRVAAVVVSRDDGRDTTLTMDVQVRARFDLVLTVDSNVRASRGALVVPYRLTNAGNASDTVRVTSGAAAATHVLASGESVTSALRIVGWDEATPTARGGVILTAAGRGAPVYAMQEVGVGGDGGGSATSVPGSLLAGVTTGPESRALVGIVAAGPLAGGRSFRLAARTHGDIAGGRALRSAVFGPQLLLGLTGPGWGFTLGDVYVPGASLGWPVQGRGVSGFWRASGYAASLLVARPFTVPGFEPTGPALRFGIAAERRAGTIGLTLVDVERPAATASGVARVQDAGVSVSRALTAGQMLRAEVGMRRLPGDSGGAPAGPTASLGYSWFRGRSSIHLGMRTAPDWQADRVVRIGEATLSAAQHLGRGVSTSQSLFGRTTSGTGPRPRTLGGSVGIGYGRPTWHVQALGNLRRIDDAPAALAGGETRTIALQSRAALGAFTGEASLEAGTSDLGGQAAPFRLARMAVRYGTPAVSALVGTTYGGVAAGAGAWQSVAQLEWHRSGLDVEAGASAAWSRGAPAGGRAASAWASARVEVLPGLSLLVGVDRPGVGSPAAPARVSFGLRRALSVPLPALVARGTAPAAGVVFEDVNGNGRRDPLEPDIAGIAVQRGSERVVSGPDGRFAFAAARGGADPMQVDSRALAAGLLAGRAVRAGGEVTIPVTRAAALVVTTIATGGGDSAAAAGVFLTLAGPDGLTRTARSDGAGAATFHALPPGAYRLTVVGHALGAGAAPRATSELILAPGESGEQRIVLAGELRPIRMQVVEQSQ